MDSPDLIDDGAALWRWVLDPASAAAVPVDPDGTAQRLGAVLSPALAAFLLAPLSQRLGRTLLDPVAVENARRLGRFTGHRQRVVVARLARAGIPFACLKGFATAHTLYPDPDLRTFGDLDLLVRPSDRGRLVDALVADGFAFRSTPRPWWGLVPTESAAPLVAADGGCNVDVHVAPDADPLPRALDAAAVIDAAATVTIGGTPVRVPSPDHAVLIQVSNIAKDKFGPFAVRKLVDLARLLDRHAGHVDGGTIEALAVRARLTRPLAATMALLLALGLPERCLPVQPRRLPGGPAAELAETLADWRRLASVPPSPWAMLRREWRLGADWPVPAQRAWRRVAGPLARGRAAA